MATRGEILVAKRKKVSLKLSEKSVSNECRFKFVLVRISCKSIAIYVCPCQDKEIM